MKKTLTLIFSLLMALMLSFSMVACGDTDDGGKTDVPPENEVWVYNTKELNALLHNPPTDKKIVLKESGDFVSKYWFANEEIESVITVNTKVHLYGENKVKVRNLKIIASAYDVTIENLTFEEKPLELLGGVNITIKDCLFTKTAQLENFLNMESAGLNQKYERQVTNLVIDGCRFEDTISTASMYKSPLIIRTFNNLTIKNCYFNNLKRFGDRPADAIRIAEKVHAPQDQRITEGNIIIENNTFGAGVTGRCIVIFRPDKTAPAESCVIRENVFYHTLKDGQTRGEDWAGAWDGTPAQRTMEKGIGSYIFYQCYDLTIGTNYWEKIPEEGNRSFIYSKTGFYDYQTQKLISQKN